MRRPCLEDRCRGYAQPGQSRCPTCQAARNRRTNHRHNQRRASAPGDGAARRARARLNRDGHGICAQCGTIKRAQELHVDHVIALADGGHDTDDNTQLLCHPHHHTKTIAEAKARRRQGA